MARFYFHIFDVNGGVKDEEGMELPDLDAAEREAASTIADWLRTNRKLAPSDIRVEIAGTDGTVFRNVQFP